MGSRQLRSPPGSRQLWSPPDSRQLWSPPDSRQLWSPPDSRQLWSPPESRQLWSPPDSSKVDQMTDLYPWWLIFSSEGPLAHFALIDYSKQRHRSLYNPAMPCHIWYAIVLQIEISSTSLMADILSVSVKKSIKCNQYLRRSTIGIWHISLENITTPPEIPGEWWWLVALNSMIQRWQRSSIVGDWKSREPVFHTFYAFKFHVIHYWKIQLQHDQRLR